MIQELCDKIKEECEKRGRSLSEVMAKADLSASIIYKWRDGSSKPRPQSIRKIAQALGIPAKTLAPEMSEAFEALAQASPLHDVGGDDVSGDFVFVGMRRSSFDTLRPFIERANAGLIEVPADLVKGLVSLIRPMSESQLVEFSLLAGF